jgi:hypothetical protein
VGKFDISFIAVAAAVDWLEFSTSDSDTKLSF